MTSTRSGMIAVALVALVVLALSSCTSTPPPNGQGNDAAITARIKAELTASSDLQHYAINVATSQGVVQLSGTVDRSEQRKEIERLARGTNGVRAVRDDIVVQPAQASKPEPQPSDATLSAQVKAKLSADPTINPLAIQVSVRAGVVTLSGHVPAAKESKRAEELVRQIPGVQGLDNQLEIGAGKN